MTKTISALTSEAVDRESVSRYSKAAQKESTFRRTTTKDEKMKCQSCDNFLSDREASRKGVFSGEYLDLCDKCVSTIPDLEYTENTDASDVTVVDEVFLEEEDHAFE